MKRIFLILLALSGSVVLSSQNENPFKQFGYDVLVASSSKGEFQEFHDQTDIVEIGSVLFNTQTNEIVKVLEKDETTIDISSATTAMSIDPLCEKYYWISPYVYVANNPVRFIDPNGMDIWEIDNEGRIRNRIKDKTQDAFYMVAKDSDGNYQRTFTTDAEGNKTYNSISFEYGTVESQRSIPFSPDGKTTDTYDVYKVRGDDNGTELFEFMSNNVTGSGTATEVSQAMTGIAGDKGLNFVTTGHMKATEPGMTHLLNGQLLHGYTIRELNHSHPYTPNPSNSDKGFASQITNIMKQRYVPVPTFNIYYVPSKQKIPFGK